MEKANNVKDEIQKAFMKMMCEKPYMEITVTDIVNKAGVARASFYRNYNSIGDVLDAAVNHLYEDLVNGIIPGITSSDERKWREFLFNHFYQFARRQKEMGKILPENMPVLFSKVDNRVEQDGAKSQKTIKEKYDVVGKVGLLNAITRKWVEGGMKETPEEMIDYIMSFIRKF